jgi:carbon storage regulator CsrA
MLVLTRKADEQILIGNDIKITLVRVRGNQVRIGIDAPRAVRIVRGELEPIDNVSAESVEIEQNDREQVFAHPQENVSRNGSKLPKNRLPNVSTGSIDPIVEATTPRPYIGRVQPAVNESGMNRPPLADFVSAS